MSALAIRCGHCTGTHHTVADVRACAIDVAAAAADAAAERAHERALEDRGYDEARAQETHETYTGAVGFIDAWHAASPDTCPPRGNH